MSSFRAISFRSATAALAVGMLLTILPAVTFAEAPPDEVLSAEWKVLGEVNRVRENQGLPALRMADDVREIARERSRSMKRLDYFAHVSPNGTNAASLLNGRGVAYRYWG